MPISYFPAPQASMTSRVFGLRAAQSGLLQPAPAWRFHRHRVLRRRQQRVYARVGSIGRDIVAHDDPDARPSPVALPLPGRSVPRLCAGRRRACDHLPRCRAKAWLRSILPMFQVPERPQRPELGRDTQRKGRHQAPRSTDRPSRNPSNQRSSCSLRNPAFRC
jgi:hypothetical protein